jgi:hypothetical protein
MRKPAARAEDGTAMITAASRARQPLSKSVPVDTAVSLTVPDPPSRIR